MDGANAGRSQHDDSKALEALWDTIQRAAATAEAEGLDKRLVAMSCYEAVAMWHAQFASRREVSEALETIRDHCNDEAYHDTKKPPYYQNQ